jgi:hypothetical protein
MIAPTFNIPTEPTTITQQGSEGASASGGAAVKAVTHRKSGRRFKSATIGFWLGGLALGTGGCILGACMPYSHPVAVTISVLFWGIYLGCFGASVGALLGWCADRTAAPPSQGLDGAGMRPRGTDNVALDRAASGDEEAPACMKRLTSAPVEKGVKVEAKGMQPFSASKES